MDTFRVVIIGASVTAHAVARGLRARDKAVAVTLITDEPYPFYERRLLLDLIAGRIKEKQLFPLAEGWYEENGISLVAGRAVSSVNPGRRTIYFAERGTMGYDLLAVASGAGSALPDIPGVKKPGVFTLRTLDEAKAFMNTVVSDPVAVVGPHADTRALGEILAQRYPAGVKMIAQSPPQNEPADEQSQGACEFLRTGVAEIIGDGRVQAVKTREGKVIAVSAVIWMEPPRARADFLSGTGVAFDGGFVRADGSFRTAEPRIFAAGAVTGPKSWDTCVDEGSRLAETLTQEMERICLTC